jgi:hypothetical protein
LLTDANGPAGFGTRISGSAAQQETALRRMVALIAASPEYVYR